MQSRRWYKPREIARLGLIKNSANSDSEASNYDFVLMLIQTGRLRAKSYATGSVARYLVPEEEIQRYHDTVSKI